jgi:proteasome lid subunit RPN8/RPN11
MTIYFAQIEEEAQRVSTREVCGFLLRDCKGSLTTMPVANISSSSDTWQIHPEEHKKAINTGLLFGLYHSHVLDDERLSSADIACSETSLLPMLVYSLKTGKFAYHRPRAAIPAFEGREFITGVRDCYSLVVDYYEKNYGVILPFYARTPDVIDKGLGDAESFLSNNMVRVTDLKKDDLITFSISNDGRENHAGIYVRDGVILHQLQGRPSMEQNYTPAWRARSVKILRLK